MSTQDALLAAVFANPEDDLPRLALCDWWDEFGTDAEKVRSEFVRVQVELEKRRRDGEGYRLSLKMRAKTLLESKKCIDWFSLRGTAPSWTMTDGFSGWLVNGSTARVTITRGFVAEVRCRLIDWCGDECHQCAGTGRSFPIDGPSIPCRRCGGSLVTGIGPEVVRRHPVERVVLTDRQPGERNSLWFWYFDSGESGLPSLPTTLNGGRQEQRCYESERAAVDDASRRVIAWAKAQVASEVAVV